MFNWRCPWSGQKIEDEQHDSLSGVGIPGTVQGKIKMRLLLVMNTAEFQTVTPVRLFRERAWMRQSQTKFWNRWIEYMLNFHGRWRARPHYTLCNYLLSATTLLLSCVQNPAIITWLWNPTSSRRLFNLNTYYKVSDVRLGHNTCGFISRKAQHSQLTR